MKRLFAVFGLIALALPSYSQTANYPEVQLAPAYAADSGAANALVATVNNCPGAYGTGMFIKVKPGHANTTTTPTLNFCGLGAITITKNGTSAVAANDLTTTAVATFIYDGTDMELQNPQTASAGVTSVTGSGVITNSASTGAVTLTVAGTSGGIVYFSSNSAWGSTGTLTAHGIVLGEGTGGAPTSTAAGATNAPLIGQGGSSDPIFSSILYPSSCGIGNIVYGSTATQLTCNTGMILNSSGAATTYDGLTTAGIGLDTVLGLSDVTAQSASQTTVNILASTPAAGHYLVRIYLDQNALCTTGTGNVYATVGWTDATHAHTAQTIPLTLANTAVSTANGYVDAAIPLWSASSQAITYTTTYTSCTTGTGTYDLHATVERTN